MCPEEDCMRTIIWFVPATILAVVGIATGLWGVGFGLASMWIGFCIYKGSIIVGQQEWYIIERLGKFRVVYFRGWHVRVIGVDTIRAMGDLLAKRLELYADEDAPDMDFKDASAPIDASIWYQIGNPVDIAEANKTDKWEKVIDSVNAWVYTYAKPEERIYNLVDGSLRPLFQDKNIDEASTDRNGIADKVMLAIEEEMKKLGVYPPSDKKRLTIEDIELPKEVIAYREMALEGKKRAEESANEAVGYWRAMKAIQENLGVTIEVARDIYETQRGLDTIRDTKPALTLIGKDLGGVLGTINLGGGKGGEK